MDALSLVLTQVRLACSQVSLLKNEFMPMTDSFVNMYQRPFLASLNLGKRRDQTIEMPFQVNKS